MAKVLVKIEGRKFHFDSRLEPAWGEAGNITNLPAQYFHIAEQVFIERPNGYYKCLKDRFANDLHPLTNKEAMMWVLSSTYLRIV